MRRFEFSEGKSNKFWEIEVEGSSFTTRHGRIGTDGRPTTKSFATPELAAKKAESAITSKLGKGYVEVGEGIDPASAKAASTAKVAAKSAKAAKAKAKAKTAEPVVDGPLAAVEETLAQNPDDIDSWAIYGDGLGEAGDPRGELVALYVAKARGELSVKELRRAEKPLLAKHAKAWFGKFVEQDDWRECFGWTFAMGFWGRIRLWVDYDHEGTDIPKALAYALDHPSGRFLRELDLGLPSASGSADYSSCIRALARRGPLPSLRRLNLGDFDREESEISWVTVGRLGPLWAALPGLERLTTRGGGVEPGAIRSETLRVLEFHSGGLPRAAGESVAAAELPALERLELWFGTQYYGGRCSATHARGILANASLAKLRYLGLKNADFADDIAAEVARATLPAKLEVLDLSMGTMTDAGAGRLLAKAKQFAKLQRLDLSDNYLSPDMCERLRAALPNARLDRQGQADGEDTYVSVGE